MNQPVTHQSLTAAKGASFAEPYEMLEACHERVHRMLGLLSRLRDYLRDHGSDTQARQAARDVMRYFDQAAPQHHRDEELHVFPILLACGTPDTRAVVHRLMEDHRLMESGWSAAREVLSAVERGCLVRLADAHEAALEAFSSLYPGHIEAEEEIAYPAAAAAMSQGALDAMGREMMRRRGVR